MSDAETEQHEKPLMGLSHDNERRLMVAGAVAGVIGLMLLLRAKSAGSSTAGSDTATASTPTADFQSQLAGLVSSTQSDNNAEFQQILAQVQRVNAGLTQTSTAIGTGYGTGGTVYTPESGIGTSGVRTYTPASAPSAAPPVHQIGPATWISRV